MPSTNSAAARYERAIRRSQCANRQADICLSKAIAVEARIKRRSATQLRKKALARLKMDLGLARAAINSGNFFLKRKNGISLWLLPNGRGPLRATILVHHGPPLPPPPPPPPPPPCDLMAALQIVAPLAAPGGKKGQLALCFRCHVELFDKQPEKCGRCSFRGGRMEEMEE
ncbi:hypothetical protein niasHS_005240 [Heterodera schachtii]|uniref:Uncharacterized protein n=2 Tax=Heterodera TaxID=34509 RepID=A0ABD2M6Q0_9BILA